MAHGRSSESNIGHLTPERTKVLHLVKLAFDECKLTELVIPQVLFCWRTDINDIKSKFRGSIL
jgi:hypothetical protein